MREYSIDELVQLILTCRLLDDKQVSTALSTLGGRNVDVEAFHSYLLKNGLMTNWQLTRLLDGHRKGYFYGNWKVLYLVGAGTFARVYRAENVNTGDVRAVKVLRNRYTDDMITRERFMREAQTVMKLRHLNIVPIYEVENYRGRIYMVMDFIEGQNMRDFVKAHGKIKLMTALDVTRDVCAGLTYAASQGISHRDIKLSNVLISATGRACLVDFGLAAGDDDDQLRSGFYNPRSVDYAGLEKTTNVARNDKRSDIFFVGCNLYHMLSGEPPLFETRERMRRMSSDRFRDITPLSNLEPDLPHRVVTLTQRMMDLDVTQRLQSAKDALDETLHVIAAIKRGDNRKYDDELTERERKEHKKKKMRITEGQGHTVMVVEANPTLQDMMRKRLRKIGYRVLILADPVRALGRFRDLDPAEDVPADCVIFGSADLGFAAIEAFNEFHQYPASRDVPAIILIKDENMDSFSSEADLREHHKILGLPIKFPKIRVALQELLGIDPQDAKYVDEEDVHEDAEQQDVV
ncbi:MAG: protein kinase domain-containing protein [Pirellulaceae bacterium]